jgi:hypothetical protein
VHVGAASENAISPGVVVPRVASFMLQGGLHNLLPSHYTRLLNSVTVPCHGVAVFWCAGFAVNNQDGSYAIIGCFQVHAWMGAADAWWCEVAEWLNWSC